MFERVVFAGGGHRCWWQAGWWDVAAPAIALAPREVAGVSAGAATACLIFANNARVALDHYHSVLGDNARNAYWGRWRGGRAAVFPHEGIYRHALHTLLGGEHFTKLQTDAPQIRVAFARAPRALPVTAAVALGLAVYNAEKHLFKPLHPRFGRRLGFRSDVATAQSCANIAELVDLIIASSCTPPFTAIQSRENRPTLDGGLVDNVPVDALTTRTPPPGDAPDTLVLVTRHYPERESVFRVGSRVYVQPGKKVPASSWDYTAPADYEATYKQGRIDAQVFLKWCENL